MPDADQMLHDSRITVASLLRAADATIEAIDLTRATASEVGAMEAIAHHLLSQAAAMRAVNFTDLHARLSYLIGLLENEDVADHTMETAQAAIADLTHLIGPPIPVPSHLPTVTEPGLSAMTAPNGGTSVATDQS